MTDDDRSRFRLALELDPNPRSKNYGSESLAAQTVTVNVENSEVVVDLKTLIVDHLRQLCKNVHQKAVFVNYFPRCYVLPVLYQLDFT